MKIFNSLTGKKEEFVPIDHKNVKMYACGITCSDDAHIGHAKQALQFDVMRRYLEYKGYNVTYVRNHTDVDDKIITNANAIHMDQKEFARNFMTRTNEDLKNLGIRFADFEPKASETIEEIVSFIQELIDKGFAYQSEVNHDVYFDTLKFPEYGKLSNRNIETEMSGVRKDVVEGKRDDRDFALWKSAKEGEIFWNSPWGKGRPGWHIECSAMCKKFLGETIDIHGGGRDLKFPHHENEIAQSEACNGKPLSKYWVHCGLVKVEGAKMSKSLGNGISIRNSLARYDAETIKLVIHQSVYRSDLNIMKGDFDQAEKHMYEFYKILKELKDLNLPETKSSLALEIKENFEKNMDDDFNTAKTIANMYDYISTIKKKISKKDFESLNGVYNTIQETYGNILSIFNSSPREYLENIKNKHLEMLSIDVKEADNLISLRNQYKQSKDYEKADACKAELTKMGLNVLDTPSGSIYEIDFEKNE